MQFRGLVFERTVAAAQRRSAFVAQLLVAKRTVRADRALVSSTSGSHSSVIMRPCASCACPFLC